MLVEKDLDSFAKHHNVWLYSPGFGADLWRPCLFAGVMCAGWRGDLISNFLGRSYEEVNKKWVEQYPEETRQAKGIYDYLNVMSPGDVVFAKEGQRALIGWGVVTSDPFYFGPEEEEWTNFRRVNWQWSGRIDLEGGKGKTFPRQTLTLLKGSESYYELLKKTFANNRGGIDGNRLERDALEELRDTLFNEIKENFNQTLKKTKEELLEESCKLDNYIKEQLNNWPEGEEGVDWNGTDAGRCVSKFVGAMHSIIAILDCASIESEKKVLYNNVLEANSAFDKVFSRIKFELTVERNLVVLLETTDELLKQIDNDKNVFCFDPVKAAEAFPEEFEGEIEEPEDPYDPGHDNDYETETQGTVRMRRGQQIYREGQMKVWGGACAVTGITNEDLLRASHAIPWADCESGKERLDPHNGLLLSVALDSLFDKDLICFEDDGRIRISSKLDTTELKKVGVTQDMRLREIHPENLPYLQAQRKRFNEKENAK